MPKVDIESADIQLLTALRGWVEDKVADLVGANSNGHAPDVDDDDDDDDDTPVSSGKNTWSRAELDAMPLKELRQLAKNLGFVAKAESGIGKKPEIFDWLEKKKKIRDEAPEDADTTDDDDTDDDTPDVEDSADDEDDDDETEDEDDDGDVSFEDLLDKEKFPFKDLLAFAKENGITVSKEERVPKASNRRKIAERLVGEAGDEDE